MNQCPKVIMNKVIQSKADNEKFSFRGLILLQLMSVYIHCTETLTLEQQIKPVVAELRCGKIFSSVKTLKIQAERVVGF